jgi:hypothetical protein
MKQNLTRWHERPHAPFINTEALVNPDQCLIPFQLMRQIEGYAVLGLIGSVFQRIMFKLHLM